jgi:hypothetical protein
MTRLPLSNPCLSSHALMLYSASITAFVDKKYLAHQTNNANMSPCNKGGKNEKIYNIISTNFNMRDSSRKVAEQIARQTPPGCSV